MSDSTCQGPDATDSDGCGQVNVTSRGSLVALSTNRSPFSLTAGQGGELIQAARWLWRRRSRRPQQDDPVVNVLG
jgi:hypothetical protein